MDYIKAYDFKLYDEDKKEHSLSDFKGKKVVLYFYPKDNTSACTEQACSYRDEIDNFTQLNAVVIGISKDTTGSHKRFSEKYGLNFLLLSDPDKKVCEAYGVLKEKSMFGKKYLGIVRSSFIINEEGYITHSFYDVVAKDNAKEMLKILNTEKG